MKLRDALRGAADRAPIDDIVVSTDRAVGRIKRDRTLRMGANGLVGAGAVAMIAFAAVGPFGSAHEGAGLDAAVAAYDGAPEAATEDFAGAMPSPMDMDRAAHPWMCGSDFDPHSGGWQWGDTSGVTFTAGDPEVDGAEIMLQNTLEAHRPVDLVSLAPDHVITWDGIVVGSLIEPDLFHDGPADEPMLPEGQMSERLEPGTDFHTLEQWTTLTPVNCWDGSPLPAGDYEVHQAWTLAYPGASSEPGGESGSESGSEPGGEPGGEPTDSVSATASELFRVAADPVTLTVEGDPVDDPFGQYLAGGAPLPLPMPIEPEPLPEGSLTPDQARELFDANVVSGSWDMAAGSQRWVKMHDSKNDPDGSDWESNYFGCMWAGETRSEFPERSAELNLLDVNIDLPASIDVSYGFVVDGNPLVTASLTNTSEYTLPGFWSGAQPQLHLVRDGQVVATAHPQDINHGGGMSILDSPAVMQRGGEVDTAIAFPQTRNAGLVPGDSVSGEYLWRDVSGCGTAGAPLEVAPGTYTVLAVQSLSVSNQEIAVSFGSPEPAIDLGGGVSGFDGNSSAFRDVVEPGSMEVDPGAVEWDAVELQSWTSLGTVTIR